MKTIQEFDQELLLWFNQFHYPWLDEIMFWLTKTVVWIPLFAFLIYLLFNVFKEKIWFPLLGVGFSLLLTDRITSGFMKPFFARLRPSQEPDLESVLHIVNGYRGGMYGFASSHAANTMGIAFFLWLLLHKKYPKIYWLFVWSCFMGYTRLYLGVHYPGDVVVGFIVGLLSAFLSFSILKYIAKRYFKQNPLAI
ncbi:MAG: phosphatase PAP2 family protein [Cyclobacteriaceae bacterium]|jgi:undecaprenyl-diphosphatase|nr:phosphatase PAP2 family protein [Cytophagales bacterium]MCZ8327869.1 phosphatase PAP2 family protein [Cyclobacteriaceae bacterium]